MSQVGHADSNMTLDVYAQLEQRIPRDHGENLDRLLRREPLGDDSEPPSMRAENVPAIRH